MIAGLLDTFLTLLRPVATEGPGGGERVDYEPTGRVHAGQRRDSGSLSEEGGELFADIRATFDIRSAHTIGEHWRVEDTEGRVYNVEHISRNRRKGMITLTCSRVNQ